MNDAPKPAEDMERIDLRHVTCGLVPAIVDALSRVAGDRAEILIRPGIETEIINGFGSGGAWDFRFLPGAGCGVARFTRRAGGRRYAPSLDTLVY